jgi:AcrR family transcriptional regulator
MVASMGTATSSTPAATRAASKPALPARSTGEQLLTEGVAPPPDIPPEIFQAALATYLDRRRLDMQALAGELGIGRATLYRKVKDRDRLLGSVVWFLTRQGIARAIDGADGHDGAGRVLGAIERLLIDVRDQPALRRLLAAEPEAALRILTSKAGPIQRGVVQTLERLLEEEERLGAMAPALDRETLAYVIVRICEGFLYADVIADSEPDVELAVDVVGHLLRDGHGRRAPRRRPSAAKGSARHDRRPGRK